MSWESRYHLETNSALGQYRIIELLGLEKTFKTESSCRAAIAKSTTNHVPSYHIVVV